jgi:hypothetical protein
MQDYYDEETEAMMSIASALTLKQKMHWSDIRRGIRERVAMFNCGRQQPPEWIRKDLKNYEWLLDIRWDYFGEQWLVERYSRRDRAWVTVLEWKDQLSFKIIESLRENDMWRFPNFKSYLEYKRMLSARRREENRKRSEDKVLEAVDNLSAKQIQQFNEVERAFRTGETVVFMGNDAVTFNRMTEGHKKALAAGEDLDPKKHKILHGRGFSHRKKGG